MAETAALHTLSAREMLERLAAGTLTSETLVAALLAHIAERDGEIEAWAHLSPEAAMAAARAADAAPRGRLRGLPFAAKDNIDAHDMPCSYGSDIHLGKVPPRDAACVATMRLAGAVLMGKTVSTEFAHRFPGPTRNPHAPRHTPGGSSSGSAAAVASGMVPVAFGSQTTGSVIRPAAYCGVVGYKPTYGDFNVSGMLANTPSFDTLGVMTRSLDDLALIRAALLDEPDTPLETVPVTRLRVGLARTPYWEEAEAGTRALIEEAAATLARAGAAITDFDGGVAFDGLDSANRAVSGFEFARTMAHERLYALDQLSAPLREGRMADGLETSYDEYVAAQVRLGKARLSLDAAFESFDVLITPAAPGPAPVGLQSTGPATFNMPWTTLHAPAVTLPVFRAGNGLPVGLQVVAPRWRDRHLLACAAAIRDALR